MAVVATLSKGYDLDYIWKQVDCGQGIVAGLHNLDLAGLRSDDGGGLEGRRW